MCRHRRARWAAKEPVFVSHLSPSWFPARSRGTLCCGHILFIFIAAEITFHKT